MLGDRENGEDREAYRSRIAVRLHLTDLTLPYISPDRRPSFFPTPVRCSARTLPSVRTACAARALQCTFRTVEHLHHSESMMSRSGAKIPHSRSAARARRGGLRPPPIGPKRQSDVPTRGRGHHGGTTQRESASRCVSVRACALPNNISNAASPARSRLFFRLTANTHLAALSSLSLSLSLSHTHTHTPLSLSLSLLFSTLLHVCVYTTLSLSRFSLLGFRCLKVYQSSSHRVVSRRVESSRLPSSVPTELSRKRERRRITLQSSTCAALAWIGKRGAVK